jgi:hypothetical protein
MHQKKSPAIKFVQNDKIEIICRTVKRASHLNGMKVRKVLVIKVANGIKIAIS